MQGTATEQDGTGSTERVPYRQVTVAQAAELRGVSVVTIRRMIKRGDLKAERVIRPQGSAYLVNLPDAGSETEQDAPPTEQPAQNVSRTQGTPADQMMALIETTITTAVEAAITPLVAELATTRETIREQAETIGALRTENDVLKAAQAQQEARTEAEPMPAPVESPTPLWHGRWSLVLAIVAVVLLLFVLVLAWPR